MSRLPNIFSDSTEKAYGHGPVDTAYGSFGFYGTMPLGYTTALHELFSVMLMKNLEADSDTVFDNAHLIFSVASLSSFAGCTVRLRVELIDNAIAYASAAAFEAATFSTEYVELVIPDTISVGDVLKSPDISSLLHVVTTVSGWASGNDFSLLIETQNTGQSATSTLSFNSLYATMKTGTLGSIFPQVAVYRYGEGYESNDQDRIAHAKIMQSAACWLVDISTEAWISNQSLSPRFGVTSTGKYVGYFKYYGFWEIAKDDHIFEASIALRSGGTYSSTYVKTARLQYEDSLVSESTPASTEAGYTDFLSRTRSSEYGDITCPASIAFYGTFTDYITALIQDAVNNTNWAYGSANIQFLFDTIYPDSLLNNYTEFYQGAVFAPLLITVGPEDPANTLYGETTEAFTLNGVTTTEWTATATVAGDFSVNALLNLPTVYVEIDGAIVVDATFAPTVTYEGSLTLAEATGIHFVSAANFLLSSSEVSSAGVGATFTAGLEKTIEIVEAATFSAVFAADIYTYIFGATAESAGFSAVFEGIVLNSTALDADIQFEYLTLAASEFFLLDGSIDFEFLSLSGLLSSPSLEGFCVLEELELEGTFGATITLEFEFLNLSISATSGVLLSAGDIVDTQFEELELLGTFGFDCAAVFEYVTLEGSIENEAVLVGDFSLMFMELDGSVLSEGFAEVSLAFMPLTLDAVLASDVFIAGVLSFEVFRLSATASAPQQIEEKAYLNFEPLTLVASLAQDTTLESNDFSITLSLRADVSMVRTLTNYRVLPSYNSTIYAGLVSGQAEINDYFILERQIDAEETEVFTLSAIVTCDLT